MNLIKAINPQIQETQPTLISIDLNKTTTRQITIRLLKTSDKNLKSMNTGKIIMIMHILLDIMQFRRQCDDILSMLKMEREAVNLDLSRNERKQRCSRQKYKKIH